MLFNSIEFFLFFIIAVTIYFRIPQRYKWLFLLGSSYYFYMCWKPEYIILIIASTLIDYFVGLQIGKADEKYKRKFYLMISLFSNLGILFGFKYFNFFNDSFRQLFDQFNIFYNVPEFNLILPVGISFYTFQTLSYTIDVYRGEKTPEKHLGIFALYVSFFPQLVAGPIERSTRLIPQFYRETSYDYFRVTNGLKLMLWGLFKKVVIADRLAQYVNIVYNNPHDYSGLPLMVATIFFAFQIYCDFSGYSDIAIGAAQVLGFNLMDNFNRPYYSKSIAEFWKRWHISLSTWFRDYLYIPLGGNRVVKWRWYYNLFIVFLVSGLWHGANWTFVIWGALHGFYLIFSIMTATLRGKIARFTRLETYPLVNRNFKVAITFALVSFSWIFFRANNLSDAFYIIANMFSKITDPGMIDIVLNGFGYGYKGFLVAIFSLVFLEIMHMIQRHGSIRQMLLTKPAWFRLTVYSFLVISILVFGVFRANQFIYFQF